jgi:hypothetical protein
MAEKRAKKRVIAPMFVEISASQATSVGDHRIHCSNTLGMVQNGPILLDSLKNHL